MQIIRDFTTVARYDWDTLSMSFSEEIVVVSICYANSPLLNSCGFMEMFCCRFSQIPALVDSGSVTKFLFVAVS